MEQAGSGGGAWNAAQRAFVKDYFETTLAHFHRKYPKLRFTFSLTGFWRDVRSLKVQGLDVLELHVWIRNQLDDFTGFKKLQKDRNPDRDYKKYMTGIHEAMKHRHELTEHMKSQMALARDWAAELGVPLTTTEAWGPWWHMDHPDLEWQWLADWCETCTALAPEYGFRGVTPWNFSHPYWENWKNIEWYRRINGRFLGNIPTPATDPTTTFSSPPVRPRAHSTAFTPKANSLAPAKALRAVGAQARQTGSYYFPDKLNAIRPANYFLRMEGE
jgi:hypothetical protein